MKKVLMMILSLIMVFVAVSAFAACGGETDDTDDDSVAAGYTTFEAEGIDFTGLSASGPSNSLVETQLIFGEYKPLDFDNNDKVIDSLSNGYCIGNMTNPDNDIDFVINSDAAATDCSLRIRMSIFNGSNFDGNTMKLNNSILAIYVNGEELEYDTIDIKGGAVAKMCSTVFKDYTISTKFDLKEGENTIRLKAVANESAAYIESAGATAGAPAIDCIKVKSTSTLSWDSNWETNKIMMGIQ